VSFNIESVRVAQDLQGSVKFDTNTIHIIDKSMTY
jgi:hypothetical protein